MSRFGCASASLSLQSLLVRMRRGLWVGLALSVALHLSLVTWRGLAEEKRVAKPLTTQFIKRQPRLSKPLELKKRPQPKRRQIRREMVAVRARVDRREAFAASLPGRWVRRLVRPNADVSRIIGFARPQLELATLAQSVDGSMQPKHALDMSLELMDLEALDTGRHHAMVIQDPSDKRNLKGFFHMAPIYSPGAKGRLAGSSRLSGTGVSAPLAIRNVVKAVNQYTSLRADEIDAIPYNSNEIMKIPCLLIYLRPLKRLQDSEAENFGRYLLRGGFAYCEDDNLPNTYGAPYMRGVIEEALGSQGEVVGRDWRFDRLPEDHALFHCFFDFDGLPVGGEHQKSPYDPRMQPIPYIEGVQVDGRLMLVLSLKNYMPFWGYGGEVNKSWLDRTRHFQFAVNIVVFALTQEGSITRRLMESVR